jgi:hypothetical protein
MNNPRNPSSEEMREVVKYEVETFGNGTDDELLTTYNAIAVFDDYVMRGYQGKMLVMVDTEGLTSVYVWEAGKIKGLNREE